MSIATFGPGGNSDSFYAEGNKSTVQSPGWVKRFGLDAFEYEAGNGLAAGEASLRAIGAKAREPYTDEMGILHIDETSMGGIFSAYEKGELFDDTFGS